MIGTNRQSMNASTRFWADEGQTFRNPVRYGLPTTRKVGQTTQCKVVFRYWSDGRTDNFQFALFPLLFFADEHFS